MILSKIVFQDRLLNCPQKSALIRTSGKLTGIACHACRAGLM